MNEEKSIIAYINIRDSIENWKLYTPNEIAKDYDISYRILNKLTVRFTGVEKNIIKLIDDVYNPEKDDMTAYDYIDDAGGYVTK